MKRGAEKQLSKDDEDDEIEEVSVPTELPVADEATLAKRTIRGLPKRASQSPAPSPSSSLNGNQPATSAPKLHAFAGFGTGSGSPSSFAPSASPSIDKPSSTAPSSTPFSFGSSASIAPSASNATKAFASFLDSPSASTATVPSASSNTLSNRPSPGTDDAALKYYSSLRGLNTSLLAAISKAVESDPFSDIANVLEQYKNHRISVQKEYDSKSSQPPSSTNGVSTTASKPAASSAPSAAPTSMPAPPASLAGFSSVPSSSSSKPGGGPTPSFGASTDTKSSGFTFPSTSASSDTIPAAPSATSTLFGTSQSSETTGSDSTKPSFSIPALSTTSSNPFSFAPSNTSKDSSKPSNPFGISSSPSTPFGSGFPTARTNTLFGSISGDAKSTENDDKDKDKDKPKSAFTFGSSSTPKPFGEGSPFGTSTPDKTTMTSGSFFGSSSGSPGKSPFNFGSGSPFGFGVSPKSGGETSPPGSKTPPVGFSFGAPPAAKVDFGAPPPKIDFGAPTPTSDSRGDTPATEGSQDSDAPPQPLTPFMYEKEGEGEEDEETTHEVKAKAYKLTKDREGKQDWTELGVGMLRLKKHRTNGVRRVFLRNGTTGKIILNFRLYNGLKPSHQKNTVSFIGHNEAGDSMPYRLRVGKAEAAENLKNALDREIEFVRGGTE